MKRIVILQPVIPHYREEFFSMLGKSNEQDIFTYESEEASKSQNFKISDVKHFHIANKSCKAFLLYNPLPLLKRKYNVLVLMLHVGHITTWLLLMTKWLHRKRIILWGQGISVKHYLSEELKPDWKLRCQMAMADGVWLYMEKEREQWQQIFPRKPMVALCNTLTGVEEMTTYSPMESVWALKMKFGIKEETILIFCARFENNYRRVDLLEETIKRLNKERFGFVIIGGGKNKPDFSPYSNVHDFGAVYDTNIKCELFALSDIYFQPGWVGLSIVEAMAYGKPIFTFVRSENTLQCVEYSYIRDGVNGKILTDIGHCIRIIEHISREEITRMGENARRYVREHLTVRNMADRAMTVIDQV